MPSSEAAPAPSEKAAALRGRGLGCFGWAEGGVDHRDLVGVDREAAGEALAGGAFGVGLEAVQVAEIGVEGFDRFDAVGQRRGEESVVVTMTARCSECAKVGPTWDFSNERPDRQGWISAWAKK